MIWERFTTAHVSDPFAFKAIARSSFTDRRAYPLNAPATGPCGRLDNPSEVRPLPSEQDIPCWMFHPLNLWPRPAISPAPPAPLRAVYWGELVPSSIAFKDWFIIGPAANGLTLGLTGAVLPVDQLPVVLKQVGLGLPMTHGLLAFRSALQGATFSSASYELLLEAFIAIVYGISGYVIFRGIERWSKRQGTLEGVLG